MTTTVTTASSGPLAANGVNPIPFTFQALSEEEIAVTRNGLGADPSSYSVTLNEDGTGSITPLTSWGTDEVYIYSDPTYQQTTEFSRHGAFYPDRINPAIDRLARSIIAQNRRIEQVSGSGGADELLREDLLSNTGSENVAFHRPEAGAGPRTLQSRLEDTVHVADFGAVGDGVADDTAELQAALNTGKKVILKSGATYLITTGLQHVTGAGFVCHDGWATIKAKTGVGGFNIKSTTAPRVLPDRTMLLCDGTDDITIRNVHFTTDGVTDVLLNGVVLNGGMATEGYDIRVAYSRFFVGGMTICNSTGSGKKRNIEIVSATDSGTAIGSPYWTGGPPQLTVMEIDNDTLAGVPSVGGVIRIGIIKNILFTGAAMTDYQQQTDGVNIVNEGSSRWDIDIGYIEGVGEPVDLFGSNNKVRVGTIKNAYNDAIKLIHGAQYNDIQVGTVEASGRSAAYISGSTSASRDTKGNHIRIGTVLNPGTYGLGLVGPVADVTVVLFGNAAATRKPVNNVVEVDSIQGNGVQLGSYVLDGGAEANNGNLVTIGMATGATVASVTAPSGNVRARSTSRGYTEMSMSAAQNLPSATMTKLAFNTVVKDIEGIAVPASNKVSVKWPGVYRVRASVRMDSWAAGVGDQWTMEIRQNTVIKRTVKGRIQMSAKDESAVIDADIFIGEEELLAPSNDITVWMSQDTGATKSVSNAAGYTVLSVTRVG